MKLFHSLRETALYPQCCAEVRTGSGHVNDPISYVAVYISVCGVVIKKTKINDLGLPFIARCMQPCNL